MRQVGTALGLLLGLIVGSFLNVVILRSGTGERLTGRSRCRSCAKTLSARELIPIVSFCIQKGRCRQCGIALLWQYPFVELICGVAYAVAAWVLLSDMGLADSARAWILIEVWIAIAAALVVLVTDIRFQIIPDGASLALFAVGTAAAFTRGTLILDILVACAVAFFFASLWFVSRGTWMGLGDAKLALGTSLIVGFPESIVGFLFSFWIGAAVAIFFILTGGKDMGSRIPFGPFILAGAVLAWFFGRSFFMLSGLAGVW